MSHSGLWLALWFFVGANAAYVFAFAYLVYCLAVGKRAHDELATATAVATGAAISWLVGYMVVGPVWALLTMPALLAAGFTCLRVCAYLREYAARVRVAHREAGR